MVNVFFFLQGEVIARLVVHATSSSAGTVSLPDVATIANMTGDEARHMLTQLALSK